MTGELKWGTNRLFSPFHMERTSYLKQASALVEFNFRVHGRFAKRGLPPFRVPMLVLVWVIAFPSRWAILAQKPAKKKQPAPPKIRLPESVRKRPSNLMNVKPPSRERRTELELAAAELDNLIETKLTEEGQSPNLYVEDEVFLRRIYLDVAGRIPTYWEAQSFLDSKDPDKRIELIDALLGSPDYVSSSYNYWADTLRLRERPQPNIVADPFLAYVKDAIRTNKPYDEWVYEMLTADGKVWENPAVGYQLRDDGMPLPYIDNTVRDLSRDTNRLRPVP